MNKLLIISGPTATGKTALAIELAKKYNGELISADSCQIYKGMDIGVGKDHPKNININLIDLIDPNQKFSVSDYQKLAIEKIKEIQNKNKLPIVVGGSGFYIDSILNQKYNTFSIRPNKFLRFILNRFSVKALQNIYRFLDKKSFLELNNSDKNNPYRLIRKIEIYIKNKFSPFRSKGELKGDFDTLHISLTALNDFLYPRIDQRVEERLKLGHLKEIKKLLKKYKWSDRGFQIACYRDFKDFFQNKKTLEESVERWKFDEHSDVRRQKTWFKKIKNTFLVDITEPDFKNKIFKKIDRWYN